MKYGYFDNDGIWHDSQEDIETHQKRPPMSFNDRRAHNERETELFNALVKILSARSKDTNKENTQ
jgi:hypothetical protein